MYNKNHILNETLPIRCRPIVIRELCNARSDNNVYYYVN